jgi:hypothetical protein
MTRFDSPILLNVFLDTALGFDEGEGRLAITFGCHLNFCVWCSLSLQVHLTAERYTAFDAPFVSAAKIGRQQSDTGSLKDLYFRRNALQWQIIECQTIHELASCPNNIRQSSRRCKWISFLESLIG